MTPDPNLDSLDRSADSEVSAAQSNLSLVTVQSGRTAEDEPVRS